MGFYVISDDYSNCNGARPFFSFSQRFSLYTLLREASIRILAANVRHSFLQPLFVPAISLIDPPLIVLMKLTLSLLIEPIYLFSSSDLHFVLMGDFTQFPRLRIEIALSSPRATEACSGPCCS